MSYVPPALRETPQGGGDPHGSSSFRDMNQQSGRSNYSNFSGNRNSGYNSARSGPEYGGGRSGYNSNLYSHNQGGSSNYGGYSSRQGGFPQGGYRQGNFGGYSQNSAFSSSRPSNRAPRSTVNELGFHGSMHRNEHLERKLFSQQHSSGINFDKYDDIPVSITGKGIPEPVNEFTKEMLGSSLYLNTELAHFTKPTPVQKYSIPIGHAGRDLMACAQTGSGKTGGFLFPTIAALCRNGAATIPESENTGSTVVYPNCLILAPTRELAQQINDESAKFTYATGIRTVVIYGGADMREQIQDIKMGCDILVATPGRLLDMMNRGIVSLACCKHLVLDEADRMLDMGFEPQIREIVEKKNMPLSSEGRQTYLFSATFPKQIQELASDFLRDYIFLTVGRVGQAAADIEQSILFVGQNEKVKKISELLRDIPSDSLVLIFVETKRTADELEFSLRQSGFPVTSIHGDKTQREREESLKYFKQKRTPIMVATDVASRGLDISGVTHVYNFDLPKEIDSYVHRIGRTGRVGNSGVAVSFMNEGDKNLARPLADHLSENNQPIPSFMEAFLDYPRGGRSGGGRGRGKGHGNFGGRDYRYDSHHGGNSGYSGYNNSHSNNQYGGAQNQGHDNSGFGNRHRSGFNTANNSSTFSSDNYNPNRNYNYGSQFQSHPQQTQHSEDGWN